MFALTESHRFYLYPKPVDMRKGFESLSAIVRTGMKRNPLSGEVFIFINKNKKLMKLLHFESGGFVLYHKRLEIGHFEIKFNTENVREYAIDYAELSMLVAGISRRNIKKIKRYRKPFYMT